MGEQESLLANFLNQYLPNKPRRWIPVLLSGMALLYSAVMLIPMFQHDESLLRRVRDTSGYELIEGRARKSLGREGQEQEETGVISLNPLVNAEVRLTAIAGSDRILIVDERVSPKLRYDNLILFAGTLLISSLVLFTFFSEKSVHASITTEPRADLGFPEKDGMVTSTADSILQIGMIGAQNRAEAMFSRSTLLLAGGIIMAFIGVAIFYVSLPSVSPNETSTNYLPKAIRPTGILIFIESIAWFLLRQYRALIEDYKSFHRIYLKRANFLAAYRLVSGEKVRPEDLFIAASLIDEDLTGRLKQGETTEAIERVKIDEPSPVFALVDLIIKRGLDKQ